MKKLYAPMEWAGKSKLSRVLRLSGTTKYIGGVYRAKRGYYAWGTDALRSEPAPYKTIKAAKRAVEKALGVVRR